MDIHKIVRERFDKDENFLTLPRSVKLAYLEIDLFEKKKIANELKRIEDEKKEKELTLQNKKDETKRQFIKIKCDITNSYAFYPYSQIIYNMSLSINKNITSIELYQNYNSDNLFIYLLNHVNKFMRFGSLDNYELMSLFKSYIIDNNFDILNYIFKKGEIILMEDFRKKIRYDNYIIEIDSEYFILEKINFPIFDSSCIAVNKLIPMIYDDFIFYHTQFYDNKRLVFTLYDEFYKSYEKKYKHIVVYDNFYFVKK